MRRADSLGCLAVTLTALMLYSVTLLPGIGTGDTAEFQWVAPALGVAHATGYPLYTLLGWAWSNLPLAGSPAWRMNLFSAVTTALAIGVVYWIARALDQRRLVACAVALALAATLTLWIQATRAEVYGLALLLQALLILALLRWRAERAPFWTIGLIIGLGLAHHRSIVLLMPGAALFVLLTRRPRAQDLASALLALLSPLLLYLYIPLRAPAWQDPWRLLLEYLAGSSAGEWLDFGRLRAEGLSRPLQLARDIIWPQLLPLGALLALLGIGRLAQRERATAALLGLSYALIFAFCSAYYTVDVDVFLIPAHLIAALLLGEGCMLLLQGLPTRAAPAAGLALLLLPLLLVGRNWRTISERNQEQWEPVARAIMAQELPAQALIAGDGYYVEGLRYLQRIEGRQPTLSFSFDLERESILAALEQQRPVYLLRPQPELGLAQHPEGHLWRVSSEPLHVEQNPAGILHWEEGLRLTGYRLESGPYQAGQTIPLVLAWQAERTPQQSYMLFVHIVGKDGQIWGQQDAPPSGAPTDRWQTGKPYIELFGPVLRPDAPPGKYSVVIGWYAYPSLLRLQRRDPGGSATDHAVLGQIEVALPSQ